MTPDGPKWGQDDFFLLIQTLPTFWATRILILIFFYFFDFLDSKFLDFQVPRFPDFQNSGLGQAWAGLGLGLAWAWLGAGPSCKNAKKISKRVSVCVSPLARTLLTF